MEINQTIIGLYVYDFNTFKQNNVVLLENIHKWNKRNEYSKSYRPNVISYLINDIAEYNRFVKCFEEAYFETTINYFVSASLFNNKISALYLPFEEGLIL